MQTYILGVKARFRGEQLVESIISAGQSYEIIWGEDARERRDGLTRLSRAFSRVYNKREISVGEFCCFSGHQKILKTFLASGMQWALILEEDAEIVKDVSEIEQLTYGKYGPAIIHLAGIDYALRSSTQETFWLREIETVNLDEKLVILHRILGNPFGAFGFLINRDAAGIAVKANSRLRFPQISDWPSTWRSKVNFYLTDTDYVSVDTAGSELAADRNFLSNLTSSRQTSDLLLKARGWSRLIVNVTLIEPFFKLILGLNFRSVIFENLYVYLYSRLLMRLRKPSQIVTDQRIEGAELKNDELFVGVLGLKKSFRGDHLIESIEKLGLKPNIVWGISVGDVGADRLLNYANQVQAKYIIGRELTAQEVSCALGHLEMYEAFLNSERDFALFFEDDSEFSEELVKTLQIRFSRNSPFILHLGGYLHPKILPKPFPATYPKKGELFRSDHGILRCLRFPVMAHGYIVNRAAMLQIVHLMRGRKVNSPADFPFAWRTLIPFYITTEQIVWQGENISNISNEREKLENSRQVSTTSQRRLRLVKSLSPLHLIYGKRIGLSGRAIVLEKYFYYLLSKYHH